VRVGYETGDLLELRGVAGEILKEAPANAAYVVNDIEQGPEGPIAWRSLLDTDFRVLRRTRLAGEVRDPRHQRWFHQATAASGVMRTDMNVLSTGQVGTTLSRRTASGESVVAFDIALDTLSTRLQAHRLTPSTQIALIDHDGHVIAHPDWQRLVGRVDRRGRPRLPGIFDTGEDALADLYRDAHGKDVRLDVPVGGREWIGVARVLLSDVGSPVTLLLAVPRDELLANVRQTVREQVLISLLIVALALPLTWLFSRRISQPLERMAEEAYSIRSFDFAQGANVESSIIEVDELARAMSAMRSTIRQFLETSAMLGAESRLDRLLERVVADTVKVTGAGQGGLYLLSEDGGTLLRAAYNGGHGNGMAALPMRVVLADGPIEPIARAAALRVTILDRARTDHIMLATPLANRDGEPVGALALELMRPAGEGTDGLASLVAFVEALSGVAAVAIETRHHVEAQRKLLNSLIEILASAIDAKSPYTGGHCQRVPVLAEMLARAACDARDGPFKEFSLDEKDWETLYVASWLHDCGKVTTPEYVVDKATKLETLYNRIHEVRARFEILKRDAEIACWKAIVRGADAEQARRTLQETWNELDEEFAFIARCNVGGESMASEDMRRVRRIAARTWMRTLDDRLGLSDEEYRRLSSVPPVALPAPESLLADRPDHVVPHRPQDIIPEHNPWGFKLSPPQHRLNLGEVHSLCVARGTLTPEERYIINEHIVQTIIMLSELPFPRHLSKVPEVACGHHERIDGTGYPRRLRGEDMSVPARIIAIADVFEALTAADRPYKSPMPLSDALRIMGTMAQNGHIDPDLFTLFVDTGVHRRYAERFLDPAQRDTAEAAA
jgi:HD-GYP domain-containing protein (c-di-GMP phosphodiesterase class II)